MRAWMGELLRERGVLAGSVIMWRLDGWNDLGCRGDELASAGELLSTSVAAVGEQAVVPDGAMRGEIRASGVL